MNPIANYITNVLEKIRRSDAARNRLAIFLITLLLVIAGKFVFDLIPRHYELSITGGDILSKRHFLIRLLQDEARDKHLDLKIVKTTGSFEALEQVDEGKVDLALVQGGIEAKFPNVTHVATISPELIHFIVKPSITDVRDFKGATINMGPRSDGTHVLANQILRQSSLNVNFDYVETNYTDEELIGMHPDKLPDVIVEVSYAPSDLADFLVKQRGYHLVEMSFPPSLAKRLGWVADEKILGYMYSIVPPVPSEDIQVVGVNLHLVANKSVDPRAILVLLKTLYRPSIQSRFGNPIDEANLLLAPGYPISKGTELYIESKQPIINQGLIDKSKAIFGLLMTLASMLAVVWKWFKSGKDEKFDESADLSSLAMDTLDKSTSVASKIN